MATMEPAKPRPQEKGSPTFFRRSLAGSHPLHDHIAAQQRQRQSIRGTHRLGTGETTTAIAIETTETTARTVPAIDVTTGTGTEIVIATVPIPAATAAITMTEIGTGTETEDTRAIDATIERIGTTMTGLIAAGPIATMIMRMKEAVNAGGRLMSETENVLLTIGIHRTTRNPKNSQGRLAP
jgi:hypothetical protein